MSVIPITIFFSLLLACLFMVLFAHEQRRRRVASAERDSLLPLAAEKPRAADPAHAHEPKHDHDHDHARGGCGCADGSRPPCHGCLKRTAAPTTTR
jgi:hypothetical protein